MYNCYCCLFAEQAVPKNIPDIYPQTPRKVYVNSKGKGGGEAKVFKENLRVHVLNQNILGGFAGEGGETKIPYMGGVWIFCGTTQGHACKQTVNGKYMTVCDFISLISSSL